MGTRRNLPILLTSAKLQSLGTEAKGLGVHVQLGPVAGPLGKNVKVRRLKGAPSVTDFGRGVEDGKALELIL